LNGGRFPRHDIPPQYKEFFIMGSTTKTTIYRCIVVIFFVFCCGGIQKRTVVNYADRTTTKLERPTEQWYPPFEIQQVNGVQLDITYNNSTARQGLRFNWEDVDVTATGICGGKKCFFPSIEWPQEIGYLVVSKDADLSLAQGKRAIALGQDLQNQFPDLKLLTPWKVERQCMSSDRARDMNSRLYQVTKRLNLTATKSFYDEGNVTVYTVPTAPMPQYFMKKRFDFKRLVQLIQEQQKRSQFNAKTFLQNFKQSVDLIEDMVRSEPCLNTDFQVILDLKTGHLWHLDLDRCFRGNANNVPIELPKVFVEPGRCEGTITKTQMWYEKMQRVLLQLPA
jgi:hypothetical protein